MVPRTVWFTDVRSVPFSAVPGPQNDQYPLGNLLAYATSEEFDIQFSFVSCISPINVIVHRHQDDSIFELFRQYFVFLHRP